MKEKLGIIAMSFLLALGASFLIFNYQVNLTGSVIYNESIISNQINFTNEIALISREQALEAINESESIISEMIENNFSITYINDTLIEAKRILQRVEYAEILRNTSTTEEEKKEAREALRLVDWKDITYNEVLVYTESIKKRKEKAFLLIDEIAVEEGKLNLPIKQPEEVRQILENAKIAFYEDRYNDAELLLEQFRNAFEQEKVEASIFAGIRKGAENFFQRYWLHMIAVLILISIIGYFVYKKLEKRLIKRKIRKMKAEKEVLINLMKKAQVERFKENKISGLVYNIRMKKYKERLQEIKEDLPVLEERLTLSEELKK